MSLNNVSSHTGSTQRLAPLTGAAKEAVSSLAGETPDKGADHLLKDLLSKTQGGSEATIQLEANAKSGFGRRG
jgi:hypothetical protein